MSQSTIEYLIRCLRSLVLLVVVIVVDLGCSEQEDLRVVVAQLVGQLHTLGTTRGAAWPQEYYHKVSMIVIQKNTNKIVKLADTWLALLTPHCSTV